MGIERIEGGHWAAELMTANKELAFQSDEKEKLLAELITANKELVFQGKEKNERAAELIIANKELVFQGEEKGKRAAELVIANKELAFQGEEKAERAAELIIANKELAFQGKEKGKRAAELIIANKELAFQNEEKGKRAAELIVANKELVFQNEEKEKRAAELIIANKELVFQNEEKADRAAELIIANKELVFQNEEKADRAAELIIANKELVFQNEEKGKRAAELVIANKELAFQGEEKADRAAELIIADKELVFQGEEKEKRAAEFITERQHRLFEKKMARLDRLNLLGQMAAGIGHEIRNPMTTVRGYLQLLGARAGNAYLKPTFDLMISELDRANAIITEFLSLAQTKPTELKFQDLNNIIKNLYPLLEADTFTQNKQICFIPGEIPNLELNGSEITQLVLNLTRNGLEAMRERGCLNVRTYVDDNKVVLAIEDEGGGIPPENLRKLGTPFFTTKDSGTGLGLATCYKIAESHNAKINVDSSSGGTTFYILFPIPAGSTKMVNIISKLG